MKKISVIVFLILALVGCAKKITITQVAVKQSEKEAAVSTAAQPESKELPNVLEQAKPLKTSEDSKKKDLIAEGKEVFEIKCSRCHGLKEPAEYNVAMWVKIVDWMGPRAKIDATEKESILAYVSFNAKK